jgi:hypothetical protein
MPARRRPVRVVAHRPADRITWLGLLLGMLAPFLPLAAVLYVYTMLALP